MIGISTYVISFFFTGCFDPIGELDVIKWDME